MSHLDAAEAIRDGLALLARNDGATWGECQRVIAALVRELSPRVLAEAEVAVSD